MPDLDTLSRLQDIRTRVLARERVTPDEMREMLSDLRRDRESASKAGAVARKAQKSAGFAGARATFTVDSLFPSGQ